MAYTARPTGDFGETVNVISTGKYHDRIRWGPIIAGLFTAIATQLVLSAIGAAIGLSGIAESGEPRSDAGDIGSAVGIWSIISLVISLAIGGWITTLGSGPMNRSSALMNGLILWATTLAASTWLLSTGVSGAFGILASNAGEAINQAQQGGLNLPNTLPNVTDDQTRDFAGNAARVGWYFTLGSLLALAASLLGSTIGARPVSKRVDQ